MLVPLGASRGRYLTPRSSGNSYAMAHPPTTILVRSKTTRKRPAFQVRKEERPFLQVSASSVRYQPPRSVGAGARVLDLYPIRELAVFVRPTFYWLLAMNSEMRTVSLSLGTIAVEVNSTMRTIYEGT